MHGFSPALLPAESCGPGAETRTHAVNNWLHQERICLWDHGLHFHEGVASLSGGEESVSWKDSNQSSEGFEIESYWKGRFPEDMETSSTGDKMVKEGPETDAVTLGSRQ